MSVSMCGGSVCFVWVPGTESDCLPFLAFSFYFVCVFRAIPSTSHLSSATGVWPFFKAWSCVQGASLSGTIFYPKACFPTVRTENVHQRRAWRIMASPLQMSLSLQCFYLLSRPMCIMMASVGGFQAIVAPILPNC